MIIKSRALVIRTVDYSESSRIATLLTDQAGKLAVMAKGARNPKSAYGHLIQPMNELEVVLYFKPGRDIQTLSQAGLVTARRQLMADYDRMMDGFRVLEWVNRFPVTAEDAAAMYQLVSRVLDLLDAGAPPNPLWMAKFLVRLSQISGYEPNVFDCTSCGKRLSDFPADQTGRFRLSGGDVWCPECSGNHDSGFSVSMATVAQIAAWLYPGTVPGVAGGVAVRDQLEHLMEKHLMYHLDL